MDRLLWAALGHIRRGNLQITSARGSVFSFGDGSGPAIAARFTSAAAQCAALLDPELRLGEAYMDGTFVIEKGSIADFIDLVTREHADAPPWTVPLAAMRYRWRRLNQLNWRGLARAQCRAPLRSRRSALLAVPRFRPAIQLRLFRNARVSRSTTPNSPRSGTSPRSSRCAARPRSSTSAAAGAALRSISPRFCGAEVTGITLSQEQLEAARATCRRTRASQAPSISGSRLSRHEGRFDRIVSVGMFEHVGVSFYDAFFTQMRRIARRRRRHGAAFDRPLERSERHQSLDRQVHLPGRLYSGAVRGAAGDRARRAARHRHRDPAPALRRDPRRPGATASSPTARRSSASTTRASCGCGNSTSPAPRWRSAART